MKLAATALCTAALSFVAAALAPGCDENAASLNGRSANVPGEWRTDAFNTWQPPSPPGDVLLHTENNARSAEALAAPLPGREFADSAALLLALYREAHEFSHELGAWSVGTSLDPPRRLPAAIDARSLYLWLLAQMASVDPSLSWLTSANANATNAARLSINLLAANEQVGEVMGEIIVHRAFGATHGHSVRAVRSDDGTWHIERRGAAWVR